MRDEIKGKATRNESFILNLDESKNEGTHWTCLFCKNGKCYYFDSYGFEPPLEIYKYCSVFNDRFYNSSKIQSPEQVICGHYCVYVLYKMDTGMNFYDVLAELF